MKHKIEQLEQLVNKNNLKLAFSKIVSYIDSKAINGIRLNEDAYLALLRLKARCEISIFDDKSYITTLRMISRVSSEQSDKLILVHQLIKEREFQAAYEEYKGLRESNSLISEQNNIKSQSQLHKLCESFYRDYSFNLLKSELREQSLQYRFEGKAADRVNNFIEELFNVSHYKRKSSREDHKPSYIAYSGLKEEPFIDVTLKSNSNMSSLLEEIKNEVIQLIQDHQGSPYVKNRLGVPKGFEHLVDNMNWRSITVFAGKKLLMEEAGRLVDLLKCNFDLADCPPLGPEIMISILEPGTHITPHYGTSNIMHTLHIPIILPIGDLGIRVGGELKKWEFGECLMFDDSFEHEAWNNTNKTRVVLIVDIWHNGLSTSEKEFLKSIMLKITSWRSYFNL